MWRGVHFSSLLQVITRIEHKKLRWMTSIPYNEVVFPKALTSAEELPPALHFFERWLRSGSSCRLDQEYPLAFRADQPNQIFVAREGDGIVAGLVTLIRNVEVKRKQFARMAFVGSVVTDPNHRQKGYQRQLFHAIEEAAEEQGWDALVLWSNQLEFYEKLGFRLGGLQASWSTQLDVPILKNIPVSVQVGTSKDIPFSSSFFEAFDRKIMRVQRTESEMRSLWQIPQMEIAATKNAYALLGKGEDFRGTCHEWAGPALEVLCCLETLRRRHPQMKILSPGVLHMLEEVAVIEAVEAAGFENGLEYLGLIKPTSELLDVELLNPESLEYPFFIWGLDSI